MPSHLLGPLLPGFVNSSQHCASGQFALNLASARVFERDEFHSFAMGTNTGVLPPELGQSANPLSAFIPEPVDNFASSGSGQLPGYHPPHGTPNPCSERWPSLHSCSQPFEQASCFRASINPSFGQGNGQGNGGWVFREVKTN